MAPPPGYTAAGVWHADFPPRELIDSTAGEDGKAVTWSKRGKVQDTAAVAAWFEQNVPVFDPMPMSESERAMYKMTAVEYIAARKAGRLSCADYTAALVKRMLHYQGLNCFMATSYTMTDQILAQAAVLDAKVAAEGVEAIAPLYGLPIPVKGTCATVDFPSCVGVGVLQHVFGRRDSELVELLKAAHCVVFGKTNVPEFACSGQTLNHANGVCRNPFDALWSTGGSSGGSAVAVAAGIAPVSITEDTGGSTRNPANQCGNFGYDPPRNKHPNAGNPGITFWRDQLGCNASSFDDCLLYDMAVTGKAAEHAAAAAAVDRLENGAIRIGFPQEFFVRYSIPASVMAHEGIKKGKKKKKQEAGDDEGLGPDISASPSILAKLAAARARLAAAGFSLLDEEWGDVRSEKLGSVSALYHMQWGWEHAPGKHWTGGLGTLTGQMGAWIDQYLEPTDVTVRDICDDVRPVGKHNPAGGMSGSAENPGSESEFRMHGLVQAECTDLWNAYFDEHDVDFILTPSTWGDASTYPELCSGGATLNVKQSDGSYAMQFLENGASKRSFWGFTKNWAVPKMLVPLGLDAEGRPVSCTCWGKAVPRASLYDDDFPKTWDLPFLYRVRRAVEAVHADPALRRAENALTLGDIFCAASAAKL
jgi:Asp-tRNA(Asn)/Glu-tRNA(Gln) amidotransferase A subunit family amidase